MAVIVEDGTIVSGANSFATVAYAILYLTARGNTTFSDADPVDQATALVRACDYLRDEALFKYRGSRVSFNQTLPWPRVGASIYRGPMIPSNAIPQGLIDAQCELCFKALSNPDLQPDIANDGGVASETIGPISTSYFKSASPRVLMTAVIGLIQPLLVLNGVIGLVPSIYQTDVTSQDLDYPFSPDDFSNHRFYDSISEP